MSKLESGESAAPPKPWDETIPIISLWMPWAMWVILGWKSIETRLHTRFAGLSGKMIGIHATAKFDDTALESAMPYLTYEQYDASKSFRRTSGAIIGTSQVSAFRKLSPWDARSAMIECQSVQRYGLVLYNSRPIEEISAKGHQGIWYLRERGDN